MRSMTNRMHQTFFGRGSHKGALNLQDLKMSDHRKTMTGNCNTWKMKDQIAGAGK